MRVIIAGSRTITKFYDVFHAYKEAGFPASEIVSGGARGVDRLGEELAELIKQPLKVFPAKWDQFGNYAGYYRNKQMGNYADALVAIWDGKSKGTKQMIDYMRGLGKPVYVKEVNAGTEI